MINNGLLTNPDLTLYNYIIYCINEARTPSSISSYISSPSSSSCKFTGFHGTTIRIPRTVGTMKIQCTVCAYLQHSVVLGIHVGKHSIHEACGYDLTYSVIYGRLMVPRILLRINTSWEFNCVRGMGHNY